MYKMKNQTIAKEVQKPGKLQKIIQSGTDSISRIKSISYENRMNDLNVKILEVTMKIRYHYPELSKYLDEVPVTIPAGKDQEITLNHLKEYYESLSSILNKYKLTYPKIAG
jgi:DNA-binding transcriptional regulator WhiA